LIRKFPDSLIPAICGFAGIFITFMKDLDNFPLVQRETFNFLMETVSDQPDVLFENAKYTDFLLSFSRFTFDSSMSLLYHILHFMPRNGIDLFLHLISSVVLCFTFCQLVIIKQLYFSQILSSVT
jgi:hypothetical protein